MCIRVFWVATSELTLLIYGFLFIRRVSRIIVRLQKLLVENISFPSRVIHFVVIVHNFRSFIKIARF